MTVCIKNMSSETTPQIHWWSFIATEEPISDSESEDEAWPDSRPSEREHREYQEFCQRMSAATRQEAIVQSS
jgi:hypothetical protein